MTHWSVDVTIDEPDDQGHTRAAARLVSGAGAPRLDAAGEALRTRFDEDVPEIGAELAAGRALIALGQRLLAQADADLERSPA
ncbi:hypothetical protein Cs7R123_14830 [Catellatospora sp. TT07R-123]|uniref:dsRBD fold-containing protein n=1 Tax=Catellatospora sp. TT07R-123 TaxID=2733863 RepID=UPI001B2C1A61|nr:dsRBD fold-containing protein [Catellatospora sp. TT07R-123]GHJ44141.1 hypothetical protein Cs7R123_14830 [Catellatospora sp. TT07R-123]